MVMKHPFLPLLCIILLSIFSRPAAAQIYSVGDDPSWVKWKTVKTENYRLIYPSGLDSLSEVYARALEKWRIPVSRSSGYVPNEKFSRKLPVVLHPFTASANGQVRWVPRGMELYTMYEAYNPSLLRWEDQLALHESRHVSQIQAGRSWAHYLIGELSEGLYIGLYPNILFLEGDAVAAETGLTGFGRGREADFLAYTRMAVLSGDKRNWYQWRWGSQNKFTPDHYTHGYMTLAGVRHFYDDPLFTKRYFYNSRRFFSFGAFQKTIRQASGLSFKDTWSAMTESYRKMWEEEDAARGPFTEGRDAAEGKRLFFNYSKTAGSWSVLSGLSESPSLVKLGENGKVLEKRPFSYNTSKLSSDGRRLYWSEAIPSPRWSLAADSKIRYMDPGSSGKKIFDLTGKGRYFNPAPGPDGTVWAVEYPAEGGSFLVRFSHEGIPLNRIKAPGTIQITEPVLTGEGTLLVGGICDEGAGIWSLTGGVFTPVFGPFPYKIHQLRGVPGSDAVVFTSDRDGTSQIYSFSLKERTLTQLTNERFGSSDPWLSPGDTLSYSALTPKGNILRKAALKDLDAKAADPSTHHIYPVAETLSAQERSLAAAASPETKISSPQEYKKVPHLFRIHSWAPFYVNYDNISSLSGDEYYEIAALGATVFFQNSLGTASGTAGYSWHDYRHTGHLKFNYTGLPVAFRLSLDYNDREAANFERVADDNPYITFSSYTGKPLLSGSLRAYIPLNFSSGGWRRGFVPMLEFAWSNDRFGRGYYSMEGMPSQMNGYSQRLVHKGEEGYDSFAGMTASVRWYSMLPVPSSRIFPKLGLGLEAGARTRFVSKGYYSPVFYAYAYGYLPGFMDTHGLKLSVLAEYHTNENPAAYESTVSIAPRGFTDDIINRFFAHSCPVQAKFSADYAMPFAPVDWSFLSPIAYIRNFELTPFVDCTVLKYKSSVTTSSGVNFILSGGADLTVRLSNFLWLPYDTRIGLRSAVNWADTAHAEHIGIDSVGSYFGFLFSTDL